MKFVRKISENELMYLDMQDLTTTFTIQYIFEYENKINTDILEQAILKTQKKYPALFVKANSDNWVINDTQTNIRIETIDSDYIFDSPIFSEKLNSKESTFEVINLITKSSNYLIFKLSHSVFDGKGALLFLENIFDEINNIEGKDCSNSINDEDFLDNLQYSNKLIDFSKSFHLKNTPHKCKNVIFMAYRYPKYHKGIISKLACILSSAFKERNVRFMVPTDIRRHQNNANLVSNLVLPIFIEASFDDNWQDVNTNFLCKVQNNEELNICSVKHFGYRFIPQIIRKFAINLLLKIKNSLKDFPAGGILSHLGRIELSSYSFPDNKAISFYSLPVQQPLMPFSVVISEFNNETTFVISYFKEQVSETLFNDIDKKIENTFSNKIDYSFNNTQCNFDTNFVDKIWEKIKNNKDKVAIVDKEKEYTYQELSDRSLEIATVLKNNDVQPKDKIIINLKRSFDYIASILAVLRVGGVFIPVDINENNYRLGSIINASNAKLMISDNNNFENIKTIKLNNISDIEMNKNIIFNYSKNAEVYNIFTSGSTGIPKGVSISIKNFTNYITWAKNTYKTNNRLTMPLFTSTSVDLTLTSLFLPLISGGVIKIYRSDFNNILLNDIYSDKDINVIKATPSHLKLFVPDENYNKKEWLIVGGENFNSSLYKNLKNYNMNIVNEYGPTEAAVGSIYHICNDESINYTNIPIGLPIANTKAYLLNADKQIISEQNETGEIVICGDSVALGYTNTDGVDFFMFDNQPAYKTGDLGYISDGMFHCIGRKDFQVKINGQRIELGEINSKILEFDKITAVETLYEKQQIVSFVVAKENICENAIFEFLSGKLSKIALPDKIIFLDKIPMSNNGKIDNESLSKMIIEKAPVILTDNPIRKVILNKFPDENFDINNNELYDIGLDSLQTLILGQEIFEKFIKKDNKDAFFKEYLRHISTLDILTIENLVEKYKD